MKTFSALLAHCAGNSPVTGEFPSQRPVTRSFDISFTLRLNTNGWVNNREAGDLRCHRTHYAITVMYISYTTRIWLLIHVWWCDWEADIYMHEINSVHWNTKRRSEYNALKMIHHEITQFWLVIAFCIQGVTETYCSFAMFVLLGFIIKCYRCMWYFHSHSTGLFLERWGSHTNKTGCNIRGVATFEKVQVYYFINFHGPDQTS